MEELNKYIELSSSDYFMVTDHHSKGNAITTTVVFVGGDKAKLIEAVEYLYCSYIDKPIVLKEIGNSDNNINNIVVEPIVINTVIDTIVTNVHVCIT